MAIKDGQGDFTLPGEAGYEDLTLQLAPYGLQLVDIPQQARQ